MAPPRPARPNAVPPPGGHAQSRRFPSFAKIDGECPQVRARAGASMRRTARVDHCCCAGRCGGQDRRNARAGLQQLRLVIGPRSIARAMTFSVARRPGPRSGMRAWWNRHCVATGGAHDQLPLTAPNLFPHFEVLLASSTTHQMTPPQTSGGLAHNGSERPAATSSRLLTPRPRRLGAIGAVRSGRLRGRVVRPGRRLAHLVYTSAAAPSPENRATSPSARHRFTVTTRSQARRFPSVDAAGRSGRSDA